jgi:hypothetical protein
MKHDETTHSVKAGIQTTATLVARVFSATVIRSGFCHLCDGFRSGFCHVRDAFSRRFLSRLWGGGREWVQSSTLYTSTLPFTSCFTKEKIEAYIAVKTDAILSQMTTTDLSADR